MTDQELYDKLCLFSHTKPDPHNGIRLEWQPEGAESPPCRVLYVPKAASGRTTCDPPGWHLGRPSSCGRPTHFEYAKSWKADVFGSLGSFSFRSVSAAKLPGIDVSGDHWRNLRVGVLPPHELPLGRVTFYLLSVNPETARIMDSWTTEGDAAIRVAADCFIAQRKFAEHAKMSIPPCTTCLLAARRVTQFVRGSDNNIAEAISEYFAGIDHASGLPEFDIRNGEFSYDIAP